jgi:hypothetical protein
MKKLENYKESSVDVGPFKYYEDYEGLFFIISFLTICLAFPFFYGVFTERTYYKNRITLLKILKTKGYNSLKYNETSTLYHYGKISYFSLVIDNRTYEIQWWHKKNEIVLSGNSDYIGLFEGDLINKSLVKDIIKYLYEFLPEEPTIAKY